jgi:Mn2+/Fe2+ NRAMP family transporter
MTNQVYSRKKSRFFISGPGALVAAAFIGPGTLTTCSMAGARFGYALLWGLLFSIVATIILQEMTARLGIITNQGLGEALRKHFSKGLPRILTWLLVIAAIVIGNAAFQTGNIMGASLGLESATGLGHGYFRIWVLATALMSFVFLYIGSYKLIERVMTGLVVIMSLTFLVTAIIISPDLTAILKGLTTPSIPRGSVITLIGLIGTTVVPYNLFLHASAIRERWQHPEQIPEARRDLSVSVILGGIISMSIVITSSVAFSGGNTAITGVADLRLQLEPLLGKWARYFMGTGLFAAGISSAMTAPLAAAYATQGTLGWERNLRSRRFRSVWMSILLTGTFFSLLGFKPLEAIVFAQAANGILLPVIAIYLLFIMNSRKVMGEHVNGWISNIAGILVVLTTIGLGARSLLSAFGII